MGMSRTVLICFEKVVYHRPDLCPKQFGLEEVDANRFRPLLNLIGKSRSGPKGTDYRSFKDYGLYIAEWENRENSYIRDLVEVGPLSPPVEGNYLLIVLLIIVENY